MNNRDSYTSYVKELLEAKGCLHLFRDVAHRIGGILAVNYANFHVGVQNSVLIPVMRAGFPLRKAF